jgi:hypothetical protein
MLTERCSETFMNGLIGRTEIEDALKRLDKLTQEEARMAAAQNLKVTHAVDDRVRGVAEAVVGIDDRVQRMADEAKRLSSPSLVIVEYGVLHVLSGNQLRENIYKWLSAPDPSTNHNIACGTRHKKTATWFFQGSIFQEWKSTGSLLWIHGKRLSRPLFNMTPSDSVLYCSWVGQKRYLVCGLLTVLARGN